MTNTEEREAQSKRIKSYIPVFKKYNLPIYQLKLEGRRGMFALVAEEITPEKRKETRLVRSMIYRGSAEIFQPYQPHPYFDILHNDLEESIKIAELRLLENQFWKLGDLPNFNSRINAVFLGNLVCLGLVSETFRKNGFSFPIQFYQIEVEQKSQRWKQTKGIIDSQDSTGDKRK